MKNQKIAIIVLGYAGLPLAVAFGKYAVVVMIFRREGLRGIDRAKGMMFTCDAELLRDCNVYIITVPTPLIAGKEPDLSYLFAASETARRYLEQNDLVIYESTVYLGCTEEDCVPVLEKASRLKYNRTFSADIHWKGSIPAIKCILLPRSGKLYSDLLLPRRKR